MIRAIPVPRSIFNRTTMQWEVPGMEAAPKKQVTKAPTTLVFSGEAVPKSDAWEPGRGCRSKCWKEQSVRRTQHYRKG